MLFLKCSGVAGGESVGDEGASVGEELVEGGGIMVGSRSRSGIGGVSNGRRVSLIRTNRSIALQHSTIRGYFESM